MHQPYPPRPPYQPPQRPRRLTDRKGFRFGCLPAIVIVWLLIIGAVLTHDSDDDKPAAKKPAHSDSIAERNKTRKAAGLALYPTGKNKAQYLDALRGLDDWFVDDKGEFDAVENGVDQCSSVDGKRPIWTAQQRFGKDGPSGRKVTEDEARRINAIVVKYICPEKG
jgi:hypothetical protein